MRRRKITFKEYCWRIVGKIWEEGRVWWRDRIIMAILLGVLGTLVSFRLGYIRFLEGTQEVLRLSVTYGLWFVALLVYFGVRAPWLVDNDRQDEVDAAKLEEEKARNECEKAEKKVYEGRPLFVLDVIKLPSWRTIRPKEQEIFKIKNVGFRPARWVRMEPITSGRGKHTLKFAEFSSLGSGQELCLDYAVDHHGMDERMLCEFFEDSPPDVPLVWWDIHINFRDTDESIGEDIVRLCFEVQTKALYFTPVPHTERKDSASEIYQTSAGLR